MLYNVDDCDNDCGRRVDSETARTAYDTLLFGDHKNWNWK